MNVQGCMPGSKDGGVYGGQERGEKSLSCSKALVLWAQVSLVNRLVHQALKAQSGEYGG